MTDFFIRLTDPTFNSEEIEYHFDLVQRRSRRSNQSFSTIEANPVELSQNVSITHKQQTITINWLLYDDGTDKSNGTFANSNISDSRISGSDVTGIVEQDVYFENYIRNNTLGASWELFGGQFDDPDGDGTDEGTPVVIQNYSSERISDNPVRIAAQLDLKVGERV